MKALVLAAGEGKRLEIFTRERPKPLIGVAGEPFLGYIIRKILRCDVEEIIFVVGYKAESVIDFIEREAKIKGFEASTIIQRERLGTGDATLLARDFIGEKSFLLVYGDIYLSDEVLPRIFHIHRKQGKRHMMATIEMDDVKDFGVVKGSEGRVIEIIEKPQRGGRGMINSGVYVFSADIFDELEILERSTRGEYEITDAINKLAKTEDVGYIQLSRDSWTDMGRPWDVLEVNMKELERRASSLERRESIIHPSIIGENIEIGEGCKVGPYVVIEDGVHIGDRSRVDHSVVMEDVHIGFESIISYSVIGYGARIGSRVKTDTLSKDPLKIPLEGKVYDLDMRRLGAMIGSSVYLADGSILSAGEIVK